MAKDADNLLELFDASQEVCREALSAALRVADERGLDPQAVIRVAFQTLQGAAFGLSFAPVSKKATRSRTSTARTRARG